MLEKPIESITLDDIQKLIDDEIQEGKSIEYKRELYRLNATDPKDQTRQREELLKDVSSFANTVGGHLILGVEEKKGVPTKICGVDCDDMDALKMRLTQIIEQGLEPRANVAIHAISNDSDKCVFVVRVMQSLVAPHRVLLRGGKFGQFWARNSGGGYSMDTSELRQSFTFSATVFDRIKEFRNDRTRSIMSGETPLPMPDGAKLICHLIPQESFSTRLSFAPAALEPFMRTLRPLAPGGGWNYRFNMDGIVTFDAGDFCGESLGYVQVFRNAMIEIVADDITYTSEDDEKKTRYLRTRYEDFLLQSLPQYLKCMEDLGISPPIWCFLTLGGVKGVAIDQRGAFGPMPPIDRETLLLPEIQITDMAGKPLDILRPLFDMIWNAAGFPRCLSFDDEGT
ncbi:MAG: ATP-binding protein [Planctomycetes bacterium]|nr:ATP-binding protein [Planctomycetota bacterium]